MFFKPITLLSADLKILAKFLTTTAEAGNVEGIPRELECGISVYAYANHVTVIVSSHDAH